jgi:alkaline phosphatase
MKKTIAGLLALCMMLGVFTGCSTNKQNETVNNEPTVNGTAINATTTVDKESNEISVPKYVFLFIGDGMSYPQIQSTSDFLGALNDEDYFMEC